MLDPLRPHGDGLDWLRRLSDPQLEAVRMHLLAEYIQLDHPSRPKKYTAPQLRLAGFLRQAGYEVQLEVPFGTYTVDCYLPAQHLAFEADGEYWHRGRTGKDRARDAKLLRDHALPVVRISDTEMAQW